MYHPIHPLHACLLLIDCQTTLSIDFDDDDDDYLMPACQTTLCDWGDDECIKILKNCKQAISPRDAGGKVIIMDVVVGYGQSNMKRLETQVMFDLVMMAVNGVERDEQEWKEMFIEAGFKDYKIRPVAGVMSVIEVYP
jgi:hypothetical protein